MRKASNEEKANYLLTKPVYPLYGFITVDCRQCFIERLTGDPDLKYEVMAPDGFHFTSGTHTILCVNLEEVRNCTAEKLESSTENC